MQALLEAGANANAKTTSGGATPLHLAAAQGNTETRSTALLDKGATSTRANGAWEQTPLMWAAAYNRVDAMQVLLKRGADIAAVSKVEDIPARERADRAANAAAQSPSRGAQGGRAAAASGGRASGLGRLALRRTQVATAARTRWPASEPPTAATRDSATPRATRPPDDAAQPRRRLREPRRSRTAKPAGTRRSQVPAAARQSDSARREERAISVRRARRQQGRPDAAAVRRSARATSTAAIALLEAGAKINQVSAGDHTSPLLMATINGHFDLAKKLLERGADPKLASDAGATPLYATINVQWAAKSLYPQPTAQTQQQTTYLELMEALLKAGADPNARLTKHLWYMSYNFDLLGVNTTGATPFWRAAYGTDVPAMKLLVKYGADPKIPTHEARGSPARRRRAGRRRQRARRIRRGCRRFRPAARASIRFTPRQASATAKATRRTRIGTRRTAWLPSVKYLVEELGADVNARDFNGYNAAAPRGRARRQRADRVSGVEGRRRRRR